MKIHVIYDKQGKLVGTLRAEPRPLTDGRQAMAVPRLTSGQKSRVIEVPENLRGAELHRHIVGLGRIG